MNGCIRWVPLTSRRNVSTVIRFVRFRRILRRLRLRDAMILMVCVFIDRARVAVVMTWIGRMRMVIILIGRMRMVNIVRTLCAIWNTMLCLDWLECMSWNPDEMIGERSLKRELQENLLISTCRRSVECPRQARLYP